MADLYGWVHILKFIDNATLFSKEEVLNEYENNKNAKNLKDLLYEKSVYPNGEKVGFYNISEFTLEDFSEKNFSIENFREYLNGFSSEVQELINVIRLIIKRDNHDYDWDLIKFKLSREDRSVSNKEKIIKWIFDWFYYFGTPYYNYKSYSNFLSNVLFYNADLKENISILYINPDNCFILQCLKYLLEKNCNCNVDLYVILHSLDLALPLMSLAIFNKINVNFFIDEQDDSQINYFDVYHELFDDKKTFDFIIQSDTESDKFMISKDKILYNYNLNVSSRIIYSVPFGHNRIDKKWLETDILESLIVLPIKKSTKIFKEDIYDSTLLIILNYDKPIERKNKVIVIDNTKNRDIISSEYTRKSYNNLICNNKIYNNSFNQFSKFAETGSAKIVSKDELILNSEQIKEQRIKQFDRNIGIKIEEREHREFEGQKLINISDLLYEIKMDSQRNYLKITSLKKDSKDQDRIVTKEADYEIEELGDLVKRASDQKIIPDNPKPYLYFSTNDSLVDKWVFFDFEIINPRLYHRMELKSTKISLEYLYYYLNSEMGINEYEYFRRGNSFIRFPHFNKIRVPIPPKEIQDKIVESMNKSTNFFNEVNQLKKVINNNFFDYKLNSSTIDEFNAGKIYSEETQEFSVSNNWEYALSGLVWPLAITYLLASSGGFEKVETANNLLRLFEFTTAFNAIVLISGLPEEIYQTYKTRIWDYAYDKRKNNNKFVNKLKLSFGSWVEFNNILSSAYKKEFKTELDKEFYTNLLNKELRKYYANLRDTRNDEFHGSITNAYDAEILINELNIPKARIFEHLNSCYNNFKLYYITGRYDDNTKEYEVIFLNGAYSMPIYSTIPYDGYLEPKSLYLHDEINYTFSKLNNNLIKFKAIDERKRDWRLYIFIGFETIDNVKKARYRCYQRREDDLIEDIDLDELM